MARKSAKPRSRSSRKSGRPLLKGLLGLLVLGLLATGIYGLYLAKEVRVKFEGKRWSLPARVYARPLELYAGAPVSIEQLAHELKVLDYRKVEQPIRPGQWARNRSRLLVQTRDFQFWDGQEPGRLLDLRFSGSTLTDLFDGASGEALDIVRLEAAEIASLHPAHAEDRVLVRRQDLPDYLVQALVATEDRRFYDHFGIDPRGIARAMLANLRAGKFVQGGSTLTQQLVKTFFLTSDRTLKRKANEALMAIMLELRYGKDEILEAYANEVYMGQDRQRAIHGFGLASYFYFGRPVDELGLPEAALLVGMLKGPSYYDPRRHPDRAQGRRDQVLDNMVAFGVIDQAEADQAKQRPLGIDAAKRKGDRRFPHFVELVTDQLRRDYREEDLITAGLRIFTTLDPWVQHTSEQGLAAHLDALDKDGKRELEGAIVALRPTSGEVIALVGGRRSGYAGFNRALQAIRPIGSLVKPAVYLTALEQPARFNLLTRLDDDTIEYELPDKTVWRPKNYDGKTHGRVQLRHALERSLNLATVNLGLQLGLDEVIKTLRKLGADQAINPYPSLLLGAVEMSPLQVAGMYQVIAARGYRAPPKAIREVTSPTGEPLRRYPLEIKQVMPAGPIFLLQRNLAGVVQNGTGRGLRRYLNKDTQVAGKTGTTDGARDTWFAGFSDDLVGVVWVGRDDNGVTGLSGASGALPVWGRALGKQVARGLDTTPPADAGYVWVDPNTGALAAEACPEAQAVPFMRGYEPSELSRCLERTSPTSSFETSRLGLPDPQSQRKPEPVRPKPKPKPKTNEPFDPWGGWLQ